MSAPSPTSSSGYPREYARVRKALGFESRRGSATSSGAGRSGRVGPTTSQPAAQREHHEDR